MSSYQVVYGPMAKAALNTRLGAATSADLTFMDPGVTPNPNEAVLVVHFSAAIAAAQAALASLVGPATRARVTIQGYRDLVSAAPWPGATSSQIKITVVEVF
jgi:hypothetical protein